MHVDPQSAISSPDHAPFRGDTSEQLVGRRSASACEVRIASEVIGLANEVAPNVAGMDPNTCFRKVERFGRLVLNEVEGAPHDADQFGGVGIGSRQTFEARSALGHMRTQVVAHGRCHARSVALAPSWRTDARCADLGIGGSVSWLCGPPNVPVFSGECRAKRGARPLQAGVERNRADAVAEERVERGPAFVCDRHCRSARVPSLPEPERSGKPLLGLSR